MAYKQRAACEFARESKALNAWLGPT
jgi:hypothetical protein